MRKIWIGVLTLALVSTIACSCPAAKQAAQEVENTTNLISPKFLQYIEADATLMPADKDDWKKLDIKNKENIKALKDALKD